MDTLSFVPKKEIYFYDKELRNSMLSRTKCKKEKRSRFICVFFHFNNGNDK